MGYMHIDNLYKNNNVMMVKELYALEKIHGTSAHIAYKGGVVSYFSGGESHPKFVALFDDAQLLEKFKEIGQPEVTVFGEAYGGKCQGMRETYGDKLRFVVFDVRIGDSWLAVPAAEHIAQKLGLEFVAYERVPATEEAVNFERDRPSRQAKRNGIEQDKPQEGVVLRPLIELTLNNGERLMAKHKRPDFSERKSKADTTLDPTKQAALDTAQAIAEEWVTPMRAEHVADKMRAALQRPLTMSDASAFIRAMQEDVYREGAGEVAQTKELDRTIGKAAVRLLQTSVLKSQNESA